MTKRNTKQVGHIKAGVMISLEISTGRKKRQYGTWLCLVTSVRHSQKGIYTVKMAGVMVKDRHGNPVDMTIASNQSTTLWKARIKDQPWSYESYPLVEPGSELDLIGGDIVREVGRKRTEELEKFEKEMAERKQKRAKIQKDQYQEELSGVGFRLFGFLILEMAGMKQKDFPNDVLRLMEPTSTKRVYPVIGFGQSKGHLTLVYRWREGRSGTCRIKLCDLRNYRILPPTVQEPPDHVLRLAQEAISASDEWNQSYTLIEVGKQQLPDFDFGRVQMEEAEPASYAFGRDFADLINAGHITTIDELRNVCWDPTHNVYWMQIS